MGAARLVVLAVAAAGCTASALLPGGTPDDGSSEGRDAAPALQDRDRSLDAAASPDYRLRDDVLTDRSSSVPEPPGDAHPLNAGARLVVPGRAGLVGTHLTACSNAVPASGNGDRWCAFTLPNRQIGLTDLWVMNVTKVLAGAAITCDGSDPSCKLLIPPGSSAALGTQLWTALPQSGPSHPTTHRFDGDTLIFHALAPDAVDLYKGPIFAWRPGWDAPRQISLGKAATTCAAHATAEVFVCVENVGPGATIDFDLTGGTLSSGATQISHIIPFRPGTLTSQWRSAFSPDGQYLAFSTGGPSINLDRETLFYVRLDAPAALTTLRAGATRWSLSADGTKLFFLDRYNYDSGGAPSGTLTMIDFPTGANETTLAPDVGSFQVLSDGAVDRGLGFLDGVVKGEGTYKVMKDRARPDDVLTVATEVLGVLALSPDRRFLYCVKGAAKLGTLVKADGSRSECALTSSPSDQFGAPFTPNGALIFWADQPDPIAGVGRGWVASTEGCPGGKLFAGGIDYWFFNGSAGMVYSDDGARDRASLKALSFPGGNSLGPPTRLQEQVGRIYAVIPGFAGLLFTLASGEGLYLYPKLPF